MFIGATRQFQAYKARDGGNAVLGIISVIFGILILVYPFITAETILFIMGVFAVVSGNAAVIAVR